MFGDNGKINIIVILKYLNNVGKINSNNTSQIELSKVDWLNLNFKNYKLTQIQHPVLKAQKIASLKLVVPLYLNSMPQMYIKYEDGRRQTVNIAIADKQAIEQEFQSLSAVYDLAWSRQTIPPINWRNERQNEIYIKYSHMASTYYEQLHLKIIETIKQIKIDDNIDMFTLIDGGCGQGEFLKRYTTQLEEMHAKNITGFDFNAENIEDCEKDYHGSAKFKIGNLLNVGEIATDINKEKLPVILTLSGSLTRLVLKDGFQALQALQSAASSEIDYLIGGGVGDVLINKSIARRVGYQKIELSNQIKTDTKLFIYQKIPREEVLTRIKKKLNKSNVLDVSLSPDPAELLILLEKDIQNKKNIVIDLSFCQLNDKLIKKINDLLKHNANIRLIFWHYNVLDVEKFIYYFSSRAQIESVRHIDSDGYLMGSRASVFSITTNLSLFDKNQPGKEQFDLKTPEGRLIKFLTTSIEFAKNNKIEKSANIYSLAVISYVLDKLNNDVNFKLIKDNMQNDRIICSSRAEAEMKRDQAFMIFDQEFGLLNFNSISEKTNRDFDKCIQLIDRCLNPNRCVYSGHREHNCTLTNFDDLIRFFLKVSAFNPNLFKREDMCKITELGALLLLNPTSEYGVKNLLEDVDSYFFFRP